jgi:hypothetical protein
VIPSGPDSIAIDQLLEDYKDAAMAHRHASREGDQERANPAYERLASVIRELRNRTEKEQEAFLDLLDDPSIEVRGWAAAHALEFVPDRAEPVLERIASGPESLEEFSARMVLREWRGGRLRFP